MAKFRKRPVVIDAIQWRGPEDNNILREFAGHWVSIVDASIIITTREGHMRVSPGDYVIRGVHGEFYPCKPDIFAATYEPVQESSK